MLTGRHSSVQVELLAGGRKKCLVVVEEKTDPRHCLTAEDVEVHHQAFLPLVVDLDLPVEGVLNELICIAVHVD